MAEVFVEEPWLHWVWEKLYDLCLSIHFMAVITINSYEQPEICQNMQIDMKQIDLNYTKMCVSTNISWFGKYLNHKKEHLNNFSYGTIPYMSQI